MARATPFHGFTIPRDRGINKKQMIINQRWPQTHSCVCASRRILRAAFNFTTLASARSLELIFRLVCVAASRLISKRSLLWSRVKLMMPPQSANPSASPTVRVLDRLTSAMIFSACFLSPARMKITGTRWGCHSAGAS